MRLKTLSVSLMVAAGLIWWWTRSPETPSVTSASHETKGPLRSPASLLPTTATALAKKAGEPEHKGTPLDLPFPGPEGHDTSPLQRYDGLKLSKPVTVNNHPQVVLAARAVPTAKYNATFGPVLFEQLGYSIVALDTKADPAWAEMVTHENDRPLMVNPANGMLGIVTGTLIIKFSDLHQADKLAGRENLELINVDESINVGYFRAPPDYSLLTAADRLRKSPEVLRVELDVVSVKKEIR